MALDVCPGVGLGVTKNENDAVLYQLSLYFFTFIDKIVNKTIFQLLMTDRRTLRINFTWCWAEALVFFYLDT